MDGNIIVLWVLILKINDYISNCGNNLRLFLKVTVNIVNIIECLNKFHIFTALYFTEKIKIDNQLKLE